MSQQPHTPFSIFIPPYRELIPLERPEEFFDDGAVYKGAGLVWELARGSSDREARAAAGRSPGTALVMVLPPAADLSPRMGITKLMERTRPQSVLPYHDEPDPEDLVGVLGRIPRDLPMELTDYLEWRGIVMDRDTRHLMRRTVELSAELRTVNALARSVYLSRRALGRRFLSRGLPVPSHWLQFCRVLRSSLMLQSTDQTLFHVACEMGYPDGFALSNQMKRLTGVRPSLARDCLGWEWIVECWLRKERREGGLTAPLRAMAGPEGQEKRSGPESGAEASEPPSMKARSSRRQARRARSRR